MPIRKRKTRAGLGVTRLRETIDRLAAIQSSLAVAVAALRAQNADIDADVARMLIRTVSDPLQDQIDTLESVIRLLESTADSRPPRKR